MRDASAYLASRRDPGGAIAGRATAAIGVAAGAGLTGYLVGRTNHWNIAGTPLPWGLTIGVGLHALDIFGLAGGMGEHVANMANGAIASWATMMGAGYGQQSRQAAGQPAGPIVAGLPAHHHHTQSLPMPRPTQRRSPLTEAELVAMSRKHR
jgi:hypothetical protein